MASYDNRTVLDSKASQMDLDWEVDMNISLETFFLFKININTDY